MRLRWLTRELPFGVQFVGFLFHYSLWIVTLGWVIHRESVYRRAELCFAQPQLIYLPLLFGIPMVLAVWGIFSLMRWRANCQKSRTRWFLWNFVYLLTILSTLVT